MLSVPAGEMTYTPPWIESWVATRVGLVLVVKRKYFIFEKYYMHIALIVQTAVFWVMTPCSLVSTLKTPWCHIPEDPNLKKIFASDGN
jgi:hypothetical protein